MAIPSTDNVPPVFITRAPAWEYGVRLDQGMESKALESRAGLEQMQAKRTKGSWRIEWTLVAGFVIARDRELRTLAEIAGPTVVPFWTEETALASTLSGVVVNLSREATLDWFAPGDYIFFRHPSLGDSFRLIESYGGTAQQVVLTAGSSPTYPAGTAVYPCRFCTRDNGQGEVDAHHEGSHEETLAFTTL